MLSGSEKYYDDIYGSMGKDYVAEATRLHELIQKYKRPDRNCSCHSSAARTAA